MANRIQPPSRLSLGSCSSVAVWSWRQYVRACLAWLLWATALPLFVCILVAASMLEICAHILIKLVGSTEAHSMKNCKTDDRSVLVLPGTCTWVGHQMGMIMYLAETYDLSGVRIAGVSSGAICAAMLLILESAGSSPSAIREKGEELFAAFGTVYEPLTSHPAAWVSRLGTVVDELISRETPKRVDSALGDRITLGVRRLELWPVPHMKAIAITHFTSRQDLVDAICAAVTFWPVVRPFPFAWFRGRLGWTDGVNVFSLYSVIEYILQLLSGRAAVTAPDHTLNGGRMPWHRTHALWNAGAMDAILPHSGGGRHFWLTPTVGGHVQLMYLLRFSWGWARRSWRDGYEHARQLDAEKYFDGLAPRRSRGAEGKS